MTWDPGARGQGSQGHPESDGTKLWPGSKGGQWAVGIPVSYIVRCCGKRSLSAGHSSNWGPWGQDSPQQQFLPLGVDAEGAL